VGDQEGAAVVLAEIVNGADVGMVQRRGSAGFQAKALEALRIASDVFGEKLESDRASEVGIFGFVDDAHSAAAEFFEDPVVRDGLADHGILSRTILRRRRAGVNERFQRKLSIPSGVSGHAERRDEGGSRSLDKNWQGVGN
jgi:hypothetical protein